MFLQIKEFLSILGLDANATKDDIKNAYRRLALLYHPDKSGEDSHEKFAKIKEAYDFLSAWDGPLEESISPSNVNWQIIFDSLLSDLTKTFRSKIKKNRKNKTKRDNDVPIISISLPVTLDEIYKACIKKLQVKVINEDQTDFSQEIYISLFNYQKTYHFVGKGDYDPQRKEWGDIVVTLDIQEHPLVKVDKVLSRFDLYIEFDFTLYDYYCRKYLALPYLNNELVEIDNIYPGQKCVCLHDKGLPYRDEIQNIDLRGNLFVHFKLVLPTFDTVPKDVKDVLQKHFVTGW